MMGRMGSFHMDGLERFREQLNRLQPPEAFVESCAKELAGRLLRLVKERTQAGDYPEGSGKKGGTLRRGWTGGKKVSAKKYANALEVRKSGGAYIIEIVNPVEYASYVEHGHRTVNHKDWVKGKFMMTISEQELERIAPRVLENRIMKYWEECVK